MSFTPAKHDADTTADVDDATAEDGGLAETGSVDRRSRADWSRMVPFMQSAAVRTLALAAGLVVWHIFTEINLNLFINFENVPGPLTVWSAFVGHVQTTEFFIHIGVSMRRIAIGYVLAAVLGIAFGLVMGRSRLGRDIIVP